MMAQTDRPSGVAGTWAVIVGSAARRYIDHGMSIYASAVSFWAVISLIPLVAMVVFGVGIFVDPEAIETFLAEMSSTIPGETMDMLTEQARTWSAVSARTSTVGLVAAVIAASWGASAGVAHLIRAINVAHDRPPWAFAARRLTAVVRTVMALVFVIPIVLLVAATSATLDAWDVDGWLRWAILATRWPLALLLFTCLLAGIYWVAPTERQKFRLLSPGVVVAGVFFLGGSAAFSVYAANADRFDRSYGSLTTIVVTMLWIYVSVSTVLFGAELDAAIAESGERSPES